MKAHCHHGLKNVYITILALFLCYDSYLANFVFDFFPSQLQVLYFIFSHNYLF